MSRAALLALGLLLSACSVEQVQTEVTRKAARSVVLNVVATTTPAPASEIATDCIIANATNAELNDLARDVGTRAGTVTVDNVRLVASKPETRACIAGKGLAPLTL
jgi:hypothetical protein